MTKYQALSSTYKKKYWKTGMYKGLLSGEEFLEIFSIPNGKNHFTEEPTR